MCMCMTWCYAVREDQKIGPNHHPHCEKYKTEKNFYLFYFEEAVNAWLPVPKETAMMISPRNMMDGDETEITFQRSDMTDEEFNNLPEAEL